MRSTAVIFVVFLLVTNLLLPGCHANPLYGQSGWFRDRSNDFDNWAGGSSWYDRGFRPVSHGLWHGGAGVAKSIGNAFGGNYDDDAEYSRSGFQFRRFGRK